MKRNRLLISVTAVLLSLPIAGCGEKDTGPSEDLTYKDLIGQWTSTRRTEEDGVKLVETFSLLFWRSDDETKYRWMYSIARDGVEAEDEGHDEDGICTVTETDLTFVPEGGEAFTLNYEFLKDDPQYDMRVVDKNGVAWNMVYHAQFGHIP